MHIILVWYMLTLILTHGNMIKHKALSCRNAAVSAQVACHHQLHTMLLLVYRRSDSRNHSATARCLRNISLTRGEHCHTWNSTVAAWSSIRTSPNLHPHPSPTGHASSNSRRSALGWSISAASITKRRQSRRVSPACADLGASWCSRCRPSCASRMLWQKHQRHQPLAFAPSRARPWAPHGFATHGAPTAHREPN